MIGRFAQGRESLSTGEASMSDFNWSTKVIDWAHVLATRPGPLSVGSDLRFLAMQEPNQSLKHSCGSHAV